MLALFLTLSHTRSENVRCQSWMLQREHAVRNNAPNVPAGGKHVPSGAWTWEPSNGHSEDTDQGPQGGLWAGQGSAGKRVTLATCNTITDAGAAHWARRRWTHCRSHLCWLTPESLVPPWRQWSTAAKVKGQRFGGKRVTAVLREPCGPQTQLAPQRDLASADSPGLGGCAETPSAEARPGATTHMLRSNTHNGAWVLLFQSSLEQLLYSIWLMVPNFCLMIFGEFLC